MTRKSSKEFVTVVRLVLGATACIVSSACAGTAEPPAETVDSVYADLAMRDGVMCAAGHDAMHCWSGASERRMEELSGSTRVVLGEESVCAIRIDGSVGCFFDTPGAAVVSANVASSHVVDVAVGAQIGCAVDARGVMSCFWLDDGSPVGSIATSVLDVAMEGGLRCALTSDGWTRCADEESGLSVRDAIGGALALAAGPGRIVMLRGDGTMLELRPDDPRIARLLAVAPGGVEVAASAELVCVRDVGNAVTCWQDRAGATPVPQLSGATHIAVDGDRVCGLARGLLACATVGAF